MLHHFITVSNTRWNAYYVNFKHASGLLSYLSPSYLHNSYTLKSQEESRGDPKKVNTTRTRTPPDERGMRGAIALPFGQNV